MPSPMPPMAAQRAQSCLRIEEEGGGVHDRVAVLKAGEDLYIAVGVVSGEDLPKSKFSRKTSHVVQHTECQVLE